MLEDSCGEHLEALGSILGPGVCGILGEVVPCGPVDLTQQTVGEESTATQPTEAVHREHRDMKTFPGAHRVSQAD